MPGEEVRSFMAERPEYTKANRFKEIVVKVYISFARESKVLSLV